MDTQTTGDAYRALEDRFRQLDAMTGAIGILEWDSQTMMPAGAAASREAQLATLRVLQHEMLSAPVVESWLDEAAEDMADPWRQANLREMRHAYTHAVALPAQLVDAVSRAVSRTEMVWRQARPANDFATVKPYLEEVLNLQREVSAAKRARLGLDNCYDALLDQFEPGGRAADIDRLFDSLAAILPELIDKVLERQSKAPRPLRPDGPFPIDAQRQLGISLMKAVGFDFTRGRLDVSAHPFCGGARDDIRLTTRYNDKDFAPAMMGVLHETGHAIYEMNLPRSWIDQPVGSSRGMVIHESQSLIVEMQAARSANFLGWLAPQAAVAFGQNGPEWTADNFRRLFCRVGRSLIRVDADEVTYPAHVILRYRLERAMLNGDLMIADLPHAWADGMQTLLGVSPPDDRQGCLQDIHWYSGAWGYFPCYTLGAMAAAQLFAAAVAACPNIPVALGRGDFAPLMGWLQTNVHEQASVDTTAGILRAATGKDLTIDPFLAHIRQRYLED